MNGQTQTEWLRTTAPRWRRAWELRRRGATYAQIGEVLGVSKATAASITERAETRMERAATVYNRAVTDPIVYGVWHEFTPEGRVQIACPRADRWQRYYEQERLKR